MAANAASRKRKAQTDARKDHRPAKVVPPPSPPAEPASLQAVTSAEELEITVDTLRALSEHPALIKAKPCRDLRTAVYDFRQACTTGTNAAGTNLTARITAALADGKYVDARVLLAEMRIRGDVPKVGALCRWVRDLDIISGLSTLPSAVPTTAALSERSAEDKERLLVVDAVLRAIGPVDLNPEALRRSAAVPGPPPAIYAQDIWDLSHTKTTTTTTSHDDVYATVLDKSILARAPSAPLSVLETTPGPLRKPPNHHPAVLYTSPPLAVALAPAPPTPIQYHAHPAVPRLGVATGVLSPDECKAIVAAGESVGFLPDAPVRPDDGGDVSILAHNFYWVVDEAFHDRLWARMAPFVPATVGGEEGGEGGEGGNGGVRRARGLNRRFRVYRYVPGAEYRCHIDGAWPPSGIRRTDTNEEPKYVYDASPDGAKQSSLFTFLVYLNDEFEGGETTFFLPGAQEGTLNAYPVRPVMGAVAMFPHGETRGALLHEGTGVRKGAKYVIRTEVEYDVEPSAA